MPFPTAGLRHFRESEFDRPDRLDTQLLEILDEIRERAGVPIKVTSDYRTQAEHEALWPDPARRPNSPHLRGTALDFKPMPFTPENRLIVLDAILDMWAEGLIPRMGLEIATRHFHLDVDDVLKRPWLWTGVSK